LSREEILKKSYMGIVTAIQEVIGIDARETNKVFLEKASKPRTKDRKYNRRS
jgi:hypothetical protein